MPKSLVQTLQLLMVGGLTLGSFKTASILSPLSLIMVLLAAPPKQTCDNNVSIVVGKQLASKARLGSARLGSARLGSQYFPNSPPSGHR